MTQKNVNKGVFFPFCGIRKILGKGGVYWLTLGF